MMKPSPMALSVDIAQIPARQVPKIWPYIQPFIAKAVRVSPGTSEQDLYLRCFNDKAQLWVVYYSIDGGPVLYGGAGTTKLEKTDKGVTCTIITYGSDQHLGLGYWVHLVDEVEAWANLEGCTQIEIHGRPGWRRALKNYSLHKKLPNNRVILQKDII